MGDGAFNCFPRLFVRRVCVALRTVSLQKKVLLLFLYFTTLSGFLLEVLCCCSCSCCTFFCSYCLGTFKINMTCMMKHIFLAVRHFFLFLKTKSCSFSCFCWLHLTEPRPPLPQTQTYTFTFIRFKNWDCSPLQSGT